MNESNVVSTNIKPTKEKVKWNVTERIILFLGIAGMIILVSYLVVDMFVPKSLIADILGGKSKVEYSFQEAVQVAIKEKTIVDYDPVTGEPNSNHTVYTYADCLWFKPDNKLFSPNYMLIPDYFLKKDNETAINVLKKTAEKGENFEVYRYDKTVSHIVYYNINGYRMKCVLPNINNKYNIKVNDEENTRIYAGRLS